jgi:hypothetical protein
VPINCQSRVHCFKALETIYWDFAQFFADPHVGPMGGAMVSYEQLIYEEDRQIVESQRPLVPTLDFKGEFSLPDDRISIAYRRSLRQIGLSW